MTYAYSSPTRIRTSVVPLNCTLDEFQGHVTQLKSVGHVKPRQPETPTFYNADALLQFEYHVTRQEDLLKRHFDDLEIWKRTLVVIAVTNSLTGVTPESIKALRKAHPSALVYRIISLNTDGGLEDSLDDKIVSTATETLSDVLEEIGGNVLQQLATLEMSYLPVGLKSPNFKLGTLSEAVKVKGHSVDRRSVSLTQDFTLKDERVGETLHVKTKSVNPEVVNKGRHAKLRGHLFLLSGQPARALKEFTDAIHILRSAGDYLWLGSATEGAAISMAQLDTAGESFSIPSDIVEMVKSSFKRGTPPLVEIMPSITEQVLHFYSLSQSAQDDAVPQVVYCETIMRFIRYLVDQTKTHDGLIPPIAVGTWGNRLYSTNLSNLGVSDQFKLLGSLADSYEQVGMGRKRSFIVYQMVEQVLPKLRNDSTESITSAISFLDALVCNYGNKKLTPSGQGWNELRTRVLQLCAQTCATLPDWEGVARYNSLLLSTTADTLHRHDQMQAYLAVKKAHDISKIHVDYWDLNLVRSASIGHMLYPPVKFGRDERLSGGSTEEKGILYTPFSYSTTSATVSPLVNNEECEFVIRLQNPYLFQVHISELFLLSDMVKLTRPLTNIVLAPNSVSELILVSPVIAKEKTDEIITCKLTSVRASVLGCSANQEYEISENGSSFTLIPPQPVLSVTDLSLTDGWLLLLEGQTLECNVTLHNISSQVECTSLSVTFSDSTFEPLRQAISEARDLPESEIYELEYFLEKRRPLKWLQEEDDVTIKPGKSFTLALQIHGKRGMTDAVVRAQYGCGSPYRELSIPIKVTVNASVELVSYDVIPLTEKSKLEFLPNMDISESYTEYCLVVIDLRNSWIHPLRIELKTKENSSTLVIGPGRVRRFILPLKRISLSRDQTLKPIPNLTNRQVLHNAKMDAQQTEQMISAFWYRETLFSKLSGVWTEIDGDRHGQVELRGIRLTRNMLNVLKMQHVSVSMCVKVDGAAIATDSLWDEVSCDQNVDFEIVITNNSDHAIYPLLRILPQIRNVAADSAPDPIEGRVLYNGVLQKPLTEIGVGESRQVSLGAIFVCPGEYEWTAMIQDMTDKRYYVQRDPLYVRAV
ncbi:Trafficking protein particle complex II-specific subunit 120 [Yarrowia sp. B02]|nr:Trafficking protein particle complex II-specific subunit 120 [Yarrowia sp. B02]